MKFFCSIFFLLTYSQLFAQMQKQITQVNDQIIPAEVRQQLKKIQNPDELLKFVYKNSFTEYSDDSSTFVVKEVDLHFSKGRIVGTVNIIMPGPSISIDVEICYMFCCTLEGGTKENCTEDIKKFKSWKKSPGCSSERTTTCN